MVDAELEVQPLVNDADEPRVPHKFARILGMRARMREYEGKDDQRFAIAAGEYVAELKKLQAHVNNTPDAIVVPGRVDRGRTDLGAGYPAGTIWD